MSAPDAPAAAGHFPDDGIPVLTEVVDAALLPEIDQALLEATDEDDVAGPPSLAMFPELEAERGFGPVSRSAPTSDVASLTEAPAVESHALPAGPQPNDPDEALSRELTEPAPHEPAEPPPDLEPAPVADSIAEVTMAPADALAPEASNAALFEASPESPAETQQAAPGIPGGEPQALPQQMPPHETSYAERYAARYAALQKLPPVELVTPFEPQPQPMPAVAEPAAPTAPPAGGGAASETPSEIETRIFEAIAARLDRLLDQRLEAIVPGVVEAALYGIQAGMTASVKQALREAVEQAVRHEFERMGNPE